jgi:Xaa-Pro aminopeptidase
MGRETGEQWELLGKWVAERNPRRVGVNTGSIQWAAGGLTHNLYLQLEAALGPELSARLESAEPLVTHWLATLTDDEITLHEHVVQVARKLLSWCFSREAIIPGVTTTEDLEWIYWQRVADLGMEVSFKPFFMITRPAPARERYGPDDRVIRLGDLVCSDVGIKYLGLNSDQQQAAYMLGPGETEAPAGLRELMRQANRLQELYLAEFREGLSGNEILAAILTRAREEQIPGAKVYSHSLSHCLHQPGPLIGLPWEQECNPGRGDVRLTPNQCFTMELCVRGPVAEWGGEEITLGLEEDVVFADGVCRVLDDWQTQFHLV